MSLVLTAREGAVQRIQINRPEKKNALTADMYAAIADALNAADADADVRVVLIHGAGDAFTAGNDLQDFLANAPRYADAPVFRFLNAISHVEKPMIAAVAGVAVGVGTTMLLHCDLIYATPTASLRTPFLDLGLIQEAGSSLTAPARLGYPRAFELICLGEPFSAERAHQAGLINAIVPAEQLEATALAAAKRLAAKPRQALMMSRRLLRQGFPDIGAMIDQEAAAYAVLMRSPEAREAFTAFLEKRPPDFAKARQNG
jgi:enoyl-CoA hydratase/carnithine racemase